MVLDSSTEDRLQRAIIRAKARNIQATQVDEARVGYDRTVYYQCGAFSHVGSHRVALHYTAEGITAVCDCEAGQNERICHHVAAALMAEEMPQIEPEPVPTAPVISLAALMDPGSEFDRPVVHVHNPKTDRERIASALIGRRFWVENDTIGVADAANNHLAHDLLRDAYLYLNIAGFTLQKSVDTNDTPQLRIVAMNSAMVSN